MLTIICLLNASSPWRHLLQFSKACYDAANICCCAYWPYDQGEKWKCLLTLGDCCPTMPMWYCGTPKYRSKLRIKHPSDLMSFDYNVSPYSSRLYSHRTRFCMRAAHHIRVWVDDPKSCWEVHLHWTSSPKLCSLRSLPCYIMQSLRRCGGLGILQGTLMPLLVAHSKLQKHSQNASLP